MPLLKATDEDEATVVQACGNIQGGGENEPLVNSALTSGDQINTTYLYRQPLPVCKNFKCGDKMEDGDGGRKNDRCQEYRRKEENGDLQTYEDGNVYIDIERSDSECKDNRKTCVSLDQPDSFSPMVNSFSNKYHRIRTWIIKAFHHSLYIAAVIGYFVYIAYVIMYNPASIFWAILDATIVLLFAINRFYRLKKMVKLVTKPILFRIRARENCISCHPRIKQYLRSTLTILVLIALIVFLVIDIHDEPKKAVPLGGITTFLVILWITSKYPFQVKWTPVIWGMILQFMLGILILRWSVGYNLCKYVGDEVAFFLQFTDKGSEFVFGEKYTDHPVVFKVLPVVVFFSSVASILYYLGVMQIIIKVIAKTLQYVLHTTAIESFSAAAQIFVGTVETSTVIKPFLKDTTLSELNAILTVGFGTVAGTVIAAYIEFGVPPQHIISASVMSAPAALAVAKLSWPETKPRKDKDLEIKIADGQEFNLMEAASAGAVTAIKLVAYVIVNLIAFVAFLAFLDYFLTFMGSQVGHPEVTFEFVCSYLFMPLAVIMGIPWADSGNLGKLIGKKIFINEFLAYKDLGAMIKADTMTGLPVVIATYVLCGFGSIAAMGINLGAFTAAEPSRREDYAKVMLRAMIGGNIACFMTACVAGVLYQDSGLISTATISNSTYINTTWFNYTLGPSIPSSSPNDVIFTTVVPDR